jgi:hypothetical protein
MLRDCLARQPELMLHGQTTAQFKKGLAIAFHQLVENRAACWSSDCFEDVAHGFYYRQVVTCLSRTGLPVWGTHGESPAIDPDGRLLIVGSGADAVQ